MSAKRSTVLRQLAITFAVLTVGLFALASATKDAKTGLAHTAGDVGWFGFLLSLLGLVVIGVVAAAMALTRRLHASAR